MTAPRRLYDEEYYRTNCEGWDQPPGQLSQRLKSFEGWVDKELDSAGNQTVVDLGFGRGEITMKLAEHKNVGHVLAIDYSMAAGRLLLERMRDDDVLADKISVIISDAIPFLYFFDGGVVDHIVAFDVLEHLPFADVVRFFEVARRRLRTAGKIFVITPISQAPTNERHVWLARDAKELEQLGLGFHFKHLGPTGSGEDHKFEYSKVYHHDDQS
jgi:cyclopropane fatty-acyl-phospholipid synthase-like methyltransferase